MALKIVRRYDANGRELRRKIWKPFDWILLWLEKYWQTLIGRWRKESDRGRKKDDD